MSYSDLLKELEESCIMQEICKKENTHNQESHKAFIDENIKIFSKFYNWNQQQIENGKLLGEELLNYHYK